MNNFGSKSIPAAGMSGPFKSLMAQGRSINVTLVSKSGDTAVVQLVAGKPLPLNIRSVTSWSGVGGFGPPAILHGFY